MRELTNIEMNLVSGAGDACSSDGGNNVGGIGDSENFGNYVVNIYEGLVSATSHIIERVANAL